MANLSLRNLYKVYNPGNVKAVKDFNLEIQDEEFVVFVGPSGCGKSTTLRMIAGLEEITKGSIYIEDKKVNEIPPKNRDISMVFQNYALYPHMSVYENMAFGLKLRKFKKKDINQKVTEAARILGIEDLLDRKPRALSGGQKQRVALGRAIVREPKVFLMDEPLSNLDAKLRVQMRAEIVKLKQRLETTFIYVTHDQTEAMTMGDKIVVMKDGYIQQVDTPEQVYKNPANMFVAGFIGSPQMNFLTALVEGKEEEDCYLVLGDNKLKLSTEQAKLLYNSSYYGKEIIMGIRPEDMYFTNESKTISRTHKFRAKVDVIEMLGSEIHLYMKFNGDSLIAKVNSNRNVSNGEVVEMVFNIDKIHLFDKDTEIAIQE